MGYTHYLRNTAEDKNVWFSDEEWEKFTHLSASLIYSWFTDEIDNFDEGARENLTIGTDNVGMFKTNRCDSVQPPKVLREIFRRDGMICFGFEEVGEYIYFEKERKEDDSFFTKGFQFCKTNREEAYDALCVALYALATSITENRLVFTSDGSYEEMEDGLSFLESLTDIKFEYPYVPAVIKDVLDRANTNEIIELVNEVFDDLKIYTDYDLEELYATCPMELVRLFERHQAKSADYYAYTSPDNVENLVSLSIVDIPNFVYEKLINVCGYEDNPKVKELVQKYI